MLFSNFSAFKIITRLRMINFPFKQKLILNLNRFEISRIRILVGTNSLKAGEDYYDVEEKIEHEKYFDPPLAYDIAVVRVNGSIEFSEKVQPIKLSTKELPVRTEIQLTGWGATSVS